MIVVLIFGAATGALLGLRPFSVLVLVPVISLVAAVTIANGVASSHDPRTVEFGLLAAVASTQIGYFVAAVAAQYLRPWAIGWSPTSFHTIQMTIGKKLRTVYELPQELPPKMVALLAHSNE